MKKDAYYFSHDSNARSDEKIIKLRTKHGWEGYGLYWAIIEKLRETKDYKLDKDYEAIAFDLHSQCERIKEIIENFGLFVVNDKNFFSKSLLIRMKVYEDKKNKARNSANIRWNKGMRTHSERNANAMLSKVKESKVKESKYNALKMHDTDFDLFWSAYPNKKSKQKAMDIFKKIDKDKLEIILKSVEDYKKTEQWQNPKYIPHPTTFLNQARWEDEIEKVAPQDEEAKYAKELYEKYGDNAIHYFTKYPLNNALKYKFLLNF